MYFDRHAGLPWRLSTNQTATKALNEERELLLLLRPVKHVGLENQSVMNRDQNVVFVNDLVSNVNIESHYPPSRSDPFHERSVQATYRTRRCLLNRADIRERKDKTMVHILDTLSRLETKMDSLTLSGGRSNPMHHLAVENDVARALTSPGNRPKDYITNPHKVITWPTIYLHLIHSGIEAVSDLQHVLQKGTPWFIHREIAKHPSSLPCDSGLPSFPITGRDGGQAIKVNFPTLTIQQIQEYSDAYFSTFNVLYPILSQEDFTNDIVTPLLKNGYGEGDPDVVIALLVYALGQLAIEGVIGRPISNNDGVASGIRGGTLDVPPGIQLFNEARRRLGFVVTHCSLENVQIHLLQSMYYEANARHLDFWRSIVSASMACQVLVRCRPIEWASPQGDMIKRAYWACLLCETMYHFDLDLPQTGIQTLEDVIPTPAFHDLHDQQGRLTGANDEHAHFQYHFLAMIALGRLISNIHKTILEPSEAQTETSGGYSGPPIPVIREMARQLDSWRSLLPRPLQWMDNDMLDHPITDFPSRRPTEPMFASEQPPIPIRHKYNPDVVTAHLRTRFYYARFIMYQPFVYKALHFPELMTQDDAHCCGLAIKSACLWPICMAPPKDKKRLVPHLFTWTQNFMSILLIFEMTRTNECLRRICDEHVNPEHIQQTAALMLEWMNDMRQVDGVAEWSWQIMEPLYYRRR